MLAEFIGSDNLALTLAAGKALANMDERSRREGVYDNSIYLIHPLYGVTDSRNQVSAVSFSSLLKDLLTSNVCKYSMRFIHTYAAYLFQYTFQHSARLIQI